VHHRRHRGGLAVAGRRGLTQPRLVPTGIGVMNAGSVIGGSALPWLAGTLAQNAGMWVLLPFILALSVAQFAVWRPIAGRLARHG
jgi:fucose permease